MKKSSKLKKTCNDNHKISDYFKNVSNCVSTESILPDTETSQRKDDVDNKRKRYSDAVVLETITNLPNSDKTPDLLNVTPEHTSKRLRENIPSPDVIPCTANADGPNLATRVTRTPTKVNDHLSEVLVIEATPEKKSTSKRKFQTKLFTKSPNALKKFNVGVIENFVQIVSPKENKHQDRERSFSETRESLEMSSSKQNKDQKLALYKGNARQELSVLKENVLEEQELQELTPPNAVHAQEENETTPTKPLSETSKVKMKFDFDFDDGLNMEFLQTLDLTTFQLCKITAVQHDRHKFTIDLISIKDNTTAICELEGGWRTIKLHVNDVVYVRAIYNHKDGNWVVNNTDGLIVYNPDLMLSTTSVVRSVFCMRRSVLKERYHVFEKANMGMVLGILVHKLLQEVLIKNIKSLSAIESEGMELMLERDTYWMCYEHNVSFDEVLSEFMEFLQIISSFVNDYTGDKISETIKDGNWSGVINQVQDIEESISCHQLGLKGKVDVSINNSSGVMPLEIKTGRCTSSVEHRGQVIFYVMMMQNLGYKVDSGLLLYLRDSVLREIPVNNKEKRDLTLLRNKLAYYLTRKPQLTDGVVEWELPKPIDHRSCSRCPYNTICCTFLSNNKNEVNLGRKHISRRQPVILQHLKPVHLEYFLKWSALLSIEGSHAEYKRKQLHEVYTVPPETREKNGCCIGHLVIKKVSGSGSLFQHSFVKSTDDYNLMSCGISLGQYVVVSTTNRPLVASGLVQYIDAHAIVVSLERNLNRNYVNHKFHIDAWSSTFSQTTNMTNLSLLLNATEQAARLRKFVIEKQPPTFATELSAAASSKATHILHKLNKMQQTAVLKSLSTNDYLLIKGMPGTGKTDTVVSLIELLVQLNKSVLITSHTHSAVDNLCLRLIERGINILRLGKDIKIHPKVLPYSETILTSSCRSAIDLEKVYENANVLAVTCIGSGHPALHYRMMDVCIVDESTQVVQCSALRALYCSKKFILIGDPDQLPPIVRSPQALKEGLSESLFERLDNPDSTVMLRLNYRMNQPITDMANALTYEGNLLTGNADVANATLQLPNFKTFSSLYKDQQWILKTLDRALLSSICVLDTGPVNIQKGLSLMLDDPKYTNKFEIAIIVELIDALFRAGVSSDAIGVIAPYCNQVSQLSIALKERNIDTNTVDQFQGRDKEIIFYSCTVHQNGITIAPDDILNSKRRLTVAITRAKHKFIMVGNIDCVRQYFIFQKLLDSLDKECFMKLTDGNLGFSWTNVMKTNDVV